MRNLLDKGTKCLIVQPKFPDLSLCNYDDVCTIAGARYIAPPLGLLTVAALLPGQWTLKLIDENVEPLRDEHFTWADIVVTGGWLPQQLRIRSIIARSHSLGRPIAVGGPGPTAQPHIYKSADYLVCGEGEITVPLFLQDLAKGRSSGVYLTQEKADMAQAVVPRFDLIDFHNYVVVGIQFARGCPFNCEFCDIIETYGRKSRTKTPGQIVKELQTLYDLGYRGHIDFVDDNFIGSKEHAKKALSAMREWGEQHHFPFYFLAQVSLDVADDEELLTMMQGVEFKFIFTGFETPDNEILKLTQKTQNVNKPFAESIRNIYAHGIVVFGFFIIGFDKESARTARNLVSAIQDAGICIPIVGTLFAIQNTQLARRLKKEDRLFERDVIQENDAMQMDQMTDGLNFITSRPRLEILQDYVQVLMHVSDPRRFYQRLLHTGQQLACSNKFNPGAVKMVQMVRMFFKLCFRAGFNTVTGWLYWKTLFIMLFKNPRALDRVLSLAALFLHYHKQMQIIIGVTNKKITAVSSIGEEPYNHLMLHGQEGLSSGPGSGSSRFAAADAAMLPNAPGRILP
jgi:radical SAM superfamily enzyme YgiQ (UPF0313 family)